MTDETKRKLNGWTVKAVVGGIVGILVFAVVNAMVQDRRDVVLNLQEINRNLATLTIEMSTVKQQLAGDRITGRMNKFDERIERIDTRLQYVEKEQARRGSYFKQKGDR